jgi:hypothetical protein
MKLIRWLSLLCVSGLLAGSPAGAQTTGQGQGYGQQGYGQQDNNNQYNQNFRRQQFQDQRGGGGNRRNRSFFGNDAAGGQFAATTQPDETPIPPAMTGDYLIFTSRDIFVRGRFIPRDSIPEQMGPRATDMLVFVGVFDRVDKNVTIPTAFLEDENSGEISPVQVGDQIAQGKISAITLDQLEYQSGGRTLHLSVGDNLSGERMYGGPTSMPVNLDFAGPTGDILKRLAQQRLKELNGGVTTPAGK